MQREVASVEAVRPLGWLRTALPHLVLFTGVVLIFLMVRGYGEGIMIGSVGTPAPEPAAKPPTNVLLQVLLAMAVIVGTSRLLGLILHRLGQPTVIGEIIGGIVLGPSLLGRVAPDLFVLIFPATSAPFLNVIAQLGVILYMYLIGLEIDVPTIRRSGGVMLAIAHASIAAPFVLGSLLALLLYPVVSTGGVPFTAFALFVGVSVSVTAFPVLARILSDQGVSKSPMGSLVLGCAAITDVAAWCLLALTVSTIQAQPADAVATLALTGVFVGAMGLLVRPLLHHLVSELEARERLTDGGIAIMAVAVLLAAFTTEVIGIHAIFGAFLLGAITPRGRVATELNDRTEAIVRVMLLPAFFAYTGLRTQIGLLGGGEDWLLCALIVAAATLGKWGGSTIAARIMGLGWRNASAVGALMNTRGLVELIVLNIGLDLKIISPTLFTMLVIMALVTTITAPPIFQLITHRAPWVPHQA